MTIGVNIVGALLRANAPVLAVVPIELIKAGSLPENAVLPALLLRTVSSTERQHLVRGSTPRTVDRVAVTVRASSWREQVQVMQLVKTACAGLTGDIGGGVRVSILTAGLGPDVRGPANSFEQTQDFRVSYDAN